MENEKTLPGEAGLVITKGGGHKDKDFRSETMQMCEFLKNSPATAAEVSIRLGIWRPNVCRHKRDLQKAGKLVELKKGICPITGFKAAFLTCDPDIILKKKLQPEFE